MNLLYLVGDGCSQEKYTEKGFVAGDIALVSRSANCLTANIVDNATAAGAGALLIANNNPSVAGPYRTRVDWHKYEDVKFPSKFKTNARQVRSQAASE
jgi:hypothetical protein